MNTIKELIKECDFFSHTQFLRYRKEENYRTLTGGVVSIVLATIFVGIFAALADDTFHNRIIVDQTNNIHELDPSLFNLTTHPSTKFMFAVGITNLDLSGSKRYFDIILQNYTITKLSNQTKRQITNISLVPCQSDQWNGVNSGIQNSYNQLNFNRWLCPPSGQIFPLQGKYTSNVFKYGKITVSQCSNSTGFATPCASKQEIQNWISINQGAVLNFYYINPLLNPGNSNYLDYYLEDGNYFNFNTQTGVSSNLFFQDYKIVTDTSLMPWTDPFEESGVVTPDLAASQTFAVGTNTIYAKIYLRKSSLKSQITRSYQKLDQTLSYIGGLFGTALLLFICISIYDKYAYEIQFGDRIFKQISNGSYGSQNFNFIVFIGYSFFNLLSKFGLTFNWNSMKKYHECRMQSLKQLDIHLLFDKISLLQEIGKIVFEDHHIRGLHMLAKPTINEARHTRRRYMTRSIIYHQLERKAREINVQPHQYEYRYNQFLSKHLRDQIKKDPKELDDQQNHEIILSKEMSNNYKMLNESSLKGEIYSQKIINKLVNQKFSSFKKQPTSANKNNERQDTEGQLVSLQSFPSIQLLNGSAFVDDNRKDKEVKNTK